MTNDELFCYLRFHGWREHPAWLSFTGIAVLTEWRRERHGADKFPSHAIGINGVPAATTCGELAAAMGRCVIEERCAS